MALADTIPVAPSNEYYEIRATSGKGYGCFALQYLKRGTRILEDEPLLIIPTAAYMHSDIKEAFEQLSADQKALYFTLYSGHGQNPKHWPSRIHESVDPHERRRIQEQHDARIGTEATLTSIFQTNCMDKDKGAAVFPHAARLNHCCNPNACFTWNAAIGKETIHIMNDVQLGEEITISYCDMIHDKALRSWELKHYGFVCDCKACANDEDVSTFAFQSASRRYRLQELERETRFLRGKHLEHGLMQEGFVEKLLEMAALHQAEGEWTARLANVFLDIALVCEFKGDMRMAALTAKKAQQVKKDCHGEDFSDYGRYGDVVQRIKGKLGV